MTARTTDPFALSAEERAMCAHACAGEALRAAQRTTTELAPYELVYHTERARLYAALAEELNGNRNVGVWSTLELVASVVGKP